MNCPTCGENATNLYCNNCIKTPRLSNSAQTPGYKPFMDSIWHRCFVEVHGQAVKDKKATVEFVDVDNLVLEKSKLDLPNFLKWLGL